MAKAILKSEEIIINKIYYIRGHKVMLNNDLAELYDVETKRLKEQVNRNLQRFPSHFMFELTKDEHEIPALCLHRTLSFNVIQCFEKWQGHRNEYKNY